MGSTRAGCGGCERPNQRTPKSSTTPKTITPPISGRSGLDRDPRRDEGETPGICGISALKRAEVSSMVANPENELKLRHSERVERMTKIIETRESIVFRGREPAKKGLRR